MITRKNKSTYVSRGQFFKIPIAFWVSLVYIVTLVLQSASKQLLLESILFTVIIIGHIALYWFSPMLTPVLLYFSIQGSLIFISAFLLPEGSPVILIGLLPILIAQSITTLRNQLKIIVSFVLLYLLFCIAIAINYGVKELPLMITIFLAILTIIIFYTIIYNRQMNENKQKAFYLNELREAHQKVEMLTRANERQRMARDLHDTLAQGLAGIIMQLEAVHVHIENKNTDRSQQIIKQSMKQARQTLKDARKAIDDLRLEALPSKEFYASVIEMIDEFKRNHPTAVVHEIQPIVNISSLTMEHSLKLLGECLRNIEKHADAKNVKISIHKIQHQLYMIIEDDGNGFSPKSTKREGGKYGILGMYERVRLLEGKIQIDSTLSIGTKITIILPLFDDESK